MSDLKSLHYTRALCSSLQHVKLEYVRADGLVSKTRELMTTLLTSASFGRRIYKGQGCRLPTIIEYG
jgi:hypothetical protein